MAALRRAWGEEDGAGVEEEFGSLFAQWWDHEHDQRVTWLAEHDGRPVGMLNMLVFVRMPKPGRLRSRWGYVANVYVLPGHRDTGTGGLLLGACTSYADDEGFARLVLSPSARSVPFYERAGFHAATELMLRPGPEG